LNLEEFFTRSAQRTALKRRPIFSNDDLVKSLTTAVEQEIDDDSDREDNYGDLDGDFSRSSAFSSSASPSSLRRPLDTARRHNFTNPTNASIAYHAFYERALTRLWAPVNALLELASQRWQGESIVDFIIPDPISDVNSDPSLERCLNDQKFPPVSSERLKAFVASLLLDQSADPTDISGVARSVVVSTIHAAKGLEWDNVLILDAHDGGLPHTRAMPKLSGQAQCSMTKPPESAALAEERRYTPD
jgi:superfamily I DNA/RNA helicase